MVTTTLLLSNAKTEPKKAPTRGKITERSRARHAAEREKRATECRERLPQPFRTDPYS